MSTDEIGITNIRYNILNSENCSPCDVIKKMADFQDDGDQKLRIFAYLRIVWQCLVAPLVFTHSTASFSKIKNLHVSGTLIAMLVS